MLDDRCKLGLVHLLPTYAGPSDPPRYTPHFICLSYRLLDDISAFFEKVASSPFLKCLFTKDQTNSRIEGYYRSLIRSAESFEVSHC
jgi:hypothetical protein